MKKKLLLLIPVFICIWVLLLGISIFIGGYISLAGLIVNIVFFIIVGCLITKNTFFRIILITISIGCSLFLGTACERKIIDMRLDKFDLNHDGLFQMDEQTPEQQYYFNRAVHDTGVLFSYLLAFPFALISAIIGIPLFNLIRYIIMRKITPIITYRKS